MQKPALRLAILMASICSLPFAPASAQDTARKPGRLLNVKEQFFQDDTVGGLADYNRAIAMNPSDASLYTYRADAYRRLGRVKEAVDDFRTGLSIRPRNVTVLDLLRNHADKMGITVHDVSVFPKGFAREEGKQVFVYMPETNTDWVGYAMCKAFWLGDVAHRKELTGRSEHVFNIEEERECWVALIDTYASLRGGAGFVADPAIEKLTEIAEAGMLNEWLVYQIASRIDPYVVLRQDAAVRQSMLAFVKRFVVADNPPVAH